MSKSCDEPILKTMGSKIMSPGANLFLRTRDITDFEVNYLKFLMSKVANISLSYKKKSEKN